MEDSNNIAFPETGTTWKWFNRTGIVFGLLLFRTAVQQADVVYQFVWAALVIGNAWCHWKGNSK